MTRKKIFILLLLLSWGIQTYTQQNTHDPKVDSILNVIESAEYDTTRINGYIDLGWHFTKTNQSKAIQYFKQGMELAITASGNTNKVKKKKRYFDLGGDCARYIADIKNNQGLYKHSYRYTRQAINYFKLSENESKIIDCYTNIGNTAFSTGDYILSMEMFHTALSKAEEIKDLEKMNASYNNLGVISVLMRNYKEAINYLEVAKNISEKLDDSVGIAYALNNIGSIYIKTAEFETALDFTERALAINRNINDNDGLSRSLNNLGIILRYQEKYHNAIEALEEALVLNRSVDDKMGMSSVLINLGNLYRYTKRYYKSTTLIKEGLEIAKKINARNEIKDAYKGLSETLYESKKYKEAYEYFLTYSELNDSIYNDENSRIYQEFEASFQNERKQRELDQKNTELLINAAALATQKKILIILLCGFFAILSFGILVFRLFRAKRKDNILLNQQNEEISFQREEIGLQARKMAKVNKELEKLSIVARETENAIIITDAKGNIEWVNPAFTKAVGYTYDEYIEQVGSTLFDVSQNKDIKKIINKCIESKKSVDYIAPNYTKDGKEIWFQTTLTPIIDNAGEIEKLVAIDTNIGKLKKAENEIIRQRDKIANQNKDIKESIEYASFIQIAILPPKEDIDNILPESFVFYKPKDIVSGDFYWITEMEGKIVLAVGDCTGHGVPGAFMSMLGIAFLNDIVIKDGVLMPNMILNYMRINVVKVLHQTGKEEEARDGIEIGVCCINKKLKSLEFSGAKIPLYRCNKEESNSSNSKELPVNGSRLLRNKESDYSNTEMQIFETIGDRMPVAYYYKMAPFSLHEINYSKGETFYISTDGYPDQFGGPKGNKLKREGLKNLLKEISYLPLNKQKYILDKEMIKWQSHICEHSMKYHEQIDDMLIFGFRL